jgi:hypothetical protein
MKSPTLLRYTRPGDVCPYSPSFMLYFFSDYDRVYTEFLYYRTY